MSVINTLSDLRRIVKGPHIQVGTRDARIIAISARKGGVGKTTTTVNLGAGLTLFQKRKVLLIDMDPQNHVEMSLRYDARGRAPDTLSNVLLQKRRDVFEIIQPTAVDGLWYVAAGTDLDNTESMMSARIGKELLLRQTLRYARTHFDIILIDCPPNLGGLTVNALVAAHHLLIPCDLSTLSLNGVDQILETLGTVQETLNPDLTLLGLVKTRVDRRNLTMNEAIENALAERYGAWLLDAEIGVSTAIAKAQHAGRPVFLSEARSTGALYYQTLAAEVDARLFPL
jgi:chromosome partitioning protein